MIIKSDNLHDLERKGSILLEKGYEVIKPVYITFWSCKYAVKLTNKPNPVSSYLRLKGSINDCQKIIEGICPKQKKDRKIVKYMEGFND